MIYSKEEKSRWLEEWKGSGKSAWIYIIVFLLYDQRRGGAGI